jgi:uncharacterized protein YigE (DUF2233 family)
MKSLICSLALSLLIAAAASAEWSPVVPGIDYQNFREGARDVHVTRVDLTNDQIVVSGTRETERGMRLSDYAKKNRALVAINGDFFDEKMKPRGLAIGPCGAWEGTKDTTSAGVIAAGRDRAAIYPQAEVMEKPEEWMTAAISGWPMIIRDCRALTAKEIPGSDVFTRSPHPRTAVGVNKEGTLLYLVVADGRREGIPGLTLPELASFMRETLSVCSAMNVDGGGSSAMWVKDNIVNVPSDGSERRVADHLAVLSVHDYTGCDLTRTNIAASPTRGSGGGPIAVPAAAAPPAAATSGTTSGRPVAATSAAPPPSGGTPTPVPPAPPVQLPPPSTIPGYPAPVPQPRPPSN